jgi:predicted secreted protein
MLRILAFLLLALIPAFASADVNPKPDDEVSLNLTSEEWVVTKTARVVIQVNAAVSSSNAGSTRDAMLASVKQMAEGEWRITSFNRSPSQNGLENWYAQFEARLPEKSLGGLNEKAQKASKPGMQLTVGEIDFTPTLDENEAARASLRKALMTKVSEELKTLNASFPGRDYRVADISFGGVQAMRAQRAYAMSKMARGNESMAAMAPAPEMMQDSGGGMQTSQKLVLSATVTFAALAPVTPAAPAKQ